MMNNIQYSKGFAEFREKMFEMLELSVLRNRCDFINHVGEPVDDWRYTAMDSSDVMRNAEEKGYEITAAEAEQLAIEFNSFMDELYRRPLRDYLNDTITKALNEVFSGEKKTNGRNK